MDCKLGVSRKYWICCVHIAWLVCRHRGHLGCVCPTSAVQLTHRRSVYCFQEVLGLQHSHTVTDPSDTP